MQAMTLEEIKAEMEKRGITYVALAKKLAMNQNSLRNILSGRVPLKETLRRHIELIFSMPDLPWLVYKINLTDKQVEDLTAGEQFPATEEGQRRKEEAVQMVLRHNAETLAALRKGGKYDEVLQQIYNVIDANRAAKAAEEKEGVET